MQMQIPFYGSANWNSNIFMRHGLGLLNLETPHGIYSGYDSSPDNMPGITVTQDPKTHLRFARTHVVISRISKRHPGFHSC
jgi:hypothetical protein